MRVLVPHVVATILASLGLEAERARAADPAPRPNIVLILADDMGWSDLGCFGGEIQTPNLDRLASEGLRFTQFYNGSRCCPSRASLLTGLYPHQAGVGGMSNDQGAPGYRGRLQPDSVTIPEVLGSAGYRTYMVGKWHLTANPGPIDRGFGEFFGMIGGFNSFFQEHPFYTRLPEGRPPRDYPPDGFYSTDAFGDYALDFLADARRAGDDRPVFLYLAFNAAHFPLHALDEDIDRYKDTYKIGWDAIRRRRHARQIELGLIDPSTPLPPLSGFETRSDFYREGQNPPWESLDADRRADLARRMAVYAAMIDRLDRNVGRVVKDLEKNGQLDNTLIFFLSDNGACAEWDPFGFDGSSSPNNILHTGDPLEEMGGPGTYHSYGSGWANACDTPFRWYKHYGEEGGICTPLIVHWPSAIDDDDEGELRRQPGHIIDVMATVVDVAGAEYPTERGGKAIQPMEGRSLLPALADRPIDRDYLAWEHEHHRAYREGKWKLVGRDEEPWELYDIEADRVEMNNLADAHPERVERLAALWQAWADRVHVEPRTGPKPAGQPKAKSKAKPKAIRR